MKTFKQFLIDVSIVEGYQVLPIDRMQRQIDRKSQRVKNLSLYRKSVNRELNKYRENPEGKHPDKKTTGAYYYNKIKAKENKPHIRNFALQIKKIKTTLRQHDSLVSRIKELENKDKGEQKIKDLIKRKTINT
jgi:hypothetical protein